MSARVVNEGRPPAVGRAERLALQSVDRLPEVGIAVIGCGYWGVNYVRLFRELGQSPTLVACDERVDRLGELRRRFSEIEVRGSMDDALAIDGVDAVVVCTPASSHHAVVRRCLEAGKHVLVEKPITTTVADAEDLIELAEARGLTLMVGHTFIYNAGIRKVADFLSEGRAGRVYYAYASRTNLGPFRQDVNVVWDLAAHDVAIFNHLLGTTPEWVSAVGARVLGSRREDVGFVSLGYPDGLVGHVHVSWADPNKVREVVIVGSEGRVAFNDLNPLEPVRIYEKSVVPSPDEASSFGEYHLLVRDGDIFSPRVQVSEPLKNQVCDFLACIATGRRPVSSAHDGREVVRVLEAIDRSILARGAPVEVAPLTRKNGNGHHNGKNGHHGPNGQNQGKNGHHNGKNGLRNDHIASAVR
jgi:predicted dehydrogenase